MKYFFILGRNPTLSLAEISAVFKNIKIQEYKNISEQVLILDLEKEIDAQALMSRLGGVIKIGTIEADIPPGSIAEETLDLLIRILQAKVQNKKVFFGFSVYPMFGDRTSRGEVRSHQIEIRNLALSLKRRLKEEGISSRWVTSKEPVLSSVVVKKNKLLTQGAEFVFLYGATPSSDGAPGRMTGQTLAVQEFEEYGLREFGRPARAIEEGMMPVKLARMMVNLAELPEEGVLLDPFCGSGTILTEALALGYRNLIGTDISEEAIKRTKENVLWMMRNIKHDTRNMKHKILQCDVRDLSKLITLSPYHPPTLFPVDAIVTEPYLGPIKIQEYKNIKIKNIIDELSELYLSAFKEFKKILKPGGRVVMIWPVFKFKNLEVRLPSRKSDFLTLGFRIAPLLLPEFEKLPFVRLTSRGSIIYSRPGQKVLREIFVFRCG